MLLQDMYYTSLVIIHCNATVPVDSICYGMNTTCCKPTAEKEILRIANREYGLLFQETLDESLQECPHIGRKLYCKCL